MRSTELPGNLEFSETAEDSSLEPAGRSPTAIMTSRGKVAAPRWRHRARPFGQPRPAPWLSLVVLLVTFSPFGAMAVAATSEPPDETAEATVVIRQADVDAPRAADLDSAAPVPRDTSRLAPGSWLPWNVVENDSGVVLRELDARVVSFSLDMADVVPSNEALRANLVNVEEAATADEAVGESELGEQRADRLRVLWAMFIDEALDNASNAAAFQVAVWMITHDDLQFAARLESPIPPEITTQAEAWVHDASQASSNTARANLMVLASPEFPDELVEVIPAGSDTVAIRTSLDDWLALFPDDGTPSSGNWATSLDDGKGPILKYLGDGTNLLRPTGSYNDDPLGLGGTPGSGAPGRNRRPGRPGAPPSGGGGGGAGSWPPIVFPPATDLPEPEGVPPGDVENPETPEIPPMPIPEPSSLLIWLAAVAAFGHRLRRNGQRRQRP